jgi:hypothetical protein
MKEYNLEEALASLNKDIKDFTEDMIQRAKQGVQVLAAQTHGLVLERAQSQLKSRRSTYVKAVGIQKISSSADDEIWSVSLERSAQWIEDGLPQRNMISKFLASPKAKTTKDGGKMLVIPFEHSKAPSEMSLAQSKLADLVRVGMKENGYNKTINGPDGHPKVGRVGSFNIANGPKSRHGTDILKGVTVYQRAVKTESGKTMIKKDVMTFRIVSSKQKSPMWDYPQLPPADIFGQVEKEVDVMWSKIVKDMVGQ